MADQWRPGLDGRMNTTMKLDVERVRWDRGGYDRRGRYYGNGEPAFRVTGEKKNFVIARSGGTEDVYVDEIVRAPNAREARRHVAERYGITPEFPRKARRPRAVLERMRAAVTHAGEMGQQAVGAHSEAIAFRYPEPYEFSARKNHDAADAYAVAADALEDAGELKQAETFRRMSEWFREAARQLERGPSRDQRRSRSRVGGRR